VALEEAKSSYGLIIALAQIGAVLGSTMATEATRFGVPALYAMGGFCSFTMVIMVRGYATFFPEHMPEPPSESTSKRPAFSSLWDGLLLIVRYDYVRLVLGISCLYEVVLTFLDYEMKVIGRARYGLGPKAAEHFATLMGHFGQATNILSFAVSLLGTSVVVRRLGLRRALRVFPVLLLLAVLLASVLPSLWVLFFSISFLKALTYALNEPSKELLYMPTSEAIKFKAKAWIDVFGARLAKALGSTITNSAKDQPQLLVDYGSMPSLLISLSLLGISIIVGKQFDELIRTGAVVGTTERAGEAIHLTSRSRHQSDAEDGKDGEDEADARAMEKLVARTEK